VGVCPENWTMDADGKANVLKKEIDEESLLCNKEAAAACPMKAITITEKESGEELL
jgi:ferredoxin